MQKSFEKTIREVRSIAEQSTLLPVVNRHQDDKLLIASAEELDEYIAELESHGTKEYSPMAAVDELNDSGVLFFSYVLENYPHLLSADSIGSVNGYGKRSAAIEEQQVVLREVKDDPNRAIPEAIARMYSIANYAPHPGVGLEYMQLTVEKVHRNRPPYLYSVYCPVLGRKLNPDEAKLKYQHLELGTRMIRDAIGRTMQTQDWWPHRELLLDWITSRENLIILQKRLQISTPPVSKNEVVVYGN